MKHLYKRLLYKIVYYFKYRFPLVSRNTMERYVQEAVRRESSRVNIEIAEKSKMLDSLIAKMFLVRVGRPDFTRYRIQVDFSDLLVTHGLVHGNSQDEIHYLCRRMAGQMEQELRTLNFARIPVGVDTYQVRGS